MRLNSYIIRHFFFAFLFGKASFLFAQNLVPNPGFETNVACPPNLGYIGYATGWATPQNHMGSPDYYNSCATGTVVYVWNNFLGGQAPASGNGYAGIILKNVNIVTPPAPSYREYLQNELSAPLVAGQTYHVSFKCSLGDFWNTPSVTTNALNLHLSVNPLVAPAIANYTEPIGLPNPLFIGNITMDTSSWTLVEFDYLALGGEKFITIGNFKTDANTYANPAGIPQIYAFIDDISVKKADILITGNQAICPGELLTLTATQGTTYSWAKADAPNVILSTSSSITVSASQNTTYYVYSNGDTGIANIVMKPLPNVHLGNDTVACSTENLLLIAYHGGAFQQGTNYLWSTGNTTPFLTPTQSGTYSVQGTLDGCIARDTIDVIINPNPSVNLGADHSICENQSVTFNVQTANATYLWQNGSTSPTFTTQQSGTFFVNVSVGTCSVSDTIHIANAPMPVLDLGNDISACLGTSVILSANNSNGSFLWSNGSTANSISPNASGSYWAELTLGNCSVKDSVNVQFFPLPMVNLGNDTLPCTGSTIVLDATTPNVSYMWQDDSNLSTYHVTQSGLYRVQITDQNQCKNSDSVKVIFVQMPSLNFFDSTLCEGKEWKLDASALGGNYNWQNHSTGSTFLVDKPGTYWAQVSNACGTISDTAIIKYERCDCYFFIPNTLTADGNSLNETFHIVAKDNCDLLQYNLSIYNRWGNLIYQSANIETDWIPQNIPIGIYEYRINYQFESSPVKNLFGHVNVLR